MINFDDVTRENIKEHNPNFAPIPDYPYRTLIIGGSGSGKTNPLINLITLMKIIYTVKIQKKQNISC